MKKQLLAQILSLAMMVQMASPLTMAKEIPQEESIQTVATLSDSTEKEIASLSLYEQFLLSQRGTFSGSPTPSYGTEDSPFVISTAAHLVELANLINDGDVTYFATAYYQLVNDIDLTGVEMTAIGINGTYSFQGNFDGNDKVISNLTITSSVKNQGLFGYTKNATITNLGIEHCDVSGDVSVGGLVGLAQATTIENCYTTGAVSGTGNLVGGLAGQLLSGSTIQNCYSTAIATAGTAGGTSYVGGLVGCADDSTIENSYATGAVSGSGTKVGGLVGGAGNINGTVIIKNSYATGAVSGTGDNVGGLVGIAGEYGTTATIQNSVALNPSVTGTGSNVNRVLGLDDGTSTDLSGNYAWKDMTGGTSSTDGTSVHGADLTYIGTTLGKQFDDIFDAGVDNGAWVYTTNGLPTLKDVGDNQSSTLPYFITTEVTGTMNITSVAELQALADYVNAGNSTASDVYTLTADLDLSGVSNWTPIGIYGKKFTGKFDGNGYTISNLTIYKPKSTHQGLFGYTNNATIDNVKLENCNVTGSNYVGGLVGYAENSTTIKDCYVTGTVTGGRYVGGLVGNAENSTIKDCYVTGVVTGSSDCVGGLVGYAYNTTIQNSYATGAVTGAVTWSNVDVGGLVGYANGNITIENCYATGTITGTGDNVGGLVGDAYNSISGTINIQNSYATGAVTGTGDSVGGLVGRAYNIGSDTNIQNSYATGTVTGTGDYVGGLVGRANLGSSGTLKIQNSVALNLSVTGAKTTNVNRVVGATTDSGSVTLTNNYAWSGMTVTDSSGSTTVSGGAANDVNGADLTYTVGTGVLSPQFSASSIFSSGSGWTYTANGLPILADVGGTQSSALPSYIIGAVAVPPSNIYTVADLQALADYVNAGNTCLNETYTLMNNLDLSGVANWTAIGDFTNSFEGTFNGGGYVISNLTINEPSTVDQGLFGVVYNGTIKNLGIENCNVTGKDDVGGLVGRTSGTIGTSTRATIENCYVTGIVSGTKYVGGLVGYAQETTIQNVYTTASVSGTGNSVGGLVGWATDATTIATSYATGAVSGDRNVGGLVGDMDDSTSTIEDSVALNPYVTGTSTNDINRVVGENDGTLTNNYAWDGMIVTRNSVVVDMGILPELQEIKTTGLHGADSPIINGAFVLETSTNVFENIFTTLSFDTSIWVIPTTPFALPYLKTVGSDSPTMTLSQEYANQVLDEFTITFDVNGGVALAPMTTVDGKLATLPTPTKYGYIFDGWYFTSTFGIKIDTTTQFVNHATIYAKWIGPPTASDFSFTAPSSLVYDGTGKTATVTADTSQSPVVTGTITIKYYDSTGTTLVASPTNVGTYVVKIDVTGDANYAPVTGLELGTFSITKATYPNTKTATASAKYGQSGTVDLSTWGNLTGAIFGTVSISDTDNVLVGNTATLTGNTLSFAFVNDDTLVGSAATVTIPVTSTNYMNFDLVVTLSLTDKTAQNISYASTIVDKFMGDAPFTNPLTQSIVDTSGGAAITYTSSDLGVATVDSTGKVTLVREGTVTITATVSATSDYTEANTTYTLTVLPSPPVSFTVTTGVSSYTEKEFFDTTGFTITVTYQDGTTETVAYLGNESLFRFNPVLGTALTPSHTTVKITYEGLTFSYPITVTAIYDLNGKVYDSDKTTLTKGAKVTLYQNGNPVGTPQTTLADGEFSFLDVTSGIYNLVATKSDLTKTVLVILDHNTEEIITMPSEGVSSAVTLPSGGDVLAVGGVDEVAEEEAEKENLQTGDKIDVSLSVEVTTDPLNKTEITAILAEDDLKDGDNITVTWLEIDLEKTVTPSSGSSVTSSVTETDTLLEIVIDLPVDSQGKRGYAIYREHGGAVDILYLGSSGERIELSADKTTLTLYAQKFSTYALVVSDVTITTPDSGSTPSPSPSVPEEDDNNSDSTGGNSTPSSSVTSPILKESENGTATISPERVANGKTVTIAVTPDEGYELDFISVVDASNNKVIVKENADGTYSFTQPITKVTIEVFFKESKQESEEENSEIFPEQLFYDVKTTDWFYPYVKFVLEHELMAGMGSDRFAPEDETLRGMIVTMLYSHADKPIPKTVMVFDDVKTTDYFYLPCVWANQNGIVAGIGDNLFAPYRAVTREEICAILYKYALSQTDLVTGYAPESSFSDGDSISSWAREAVNWCNANSIVSGHYGGYFAPSDSAKRSEIATMLTKFVLLLED
ncbi:MAG: GLUG motif-containing protein [Eubacteriales bacterium]